jgi:hypothetical protein
LLGVPCPDGYAPEVLFEEGKMMKRFLCFLKYGHVWKELGPMPGGTMFQCQHCLLTEIFDNATGKRR